MERKGIIKKTILKNAVQITIVIIAVVYNSRLWGWTSDNYKIGSGTHRTSDIVNWVNSNPVANGGELSGATPITPTHSNLLLPYLYSYAHHSSNHSTIYLNGDEYYEPPKPPIIPIPLIIPFQGIAGAITGYGMAYFGTIAGFYIHSKIAPAPPDETPEAYFGGMIVGSLAGFFVGAPLGIWGAGKCFGLEGSFGKTFRGSLIGSIGITATTLLVTRKVELAEVIATVISGSIIGGLLGFYVN